MPDLSDVPIEDLQAEITRRHTFDQWCKLAEIKGHVFNALRVARTTENISGAFYDADWMLERLEELNQDVKKYERAAYEATKEQPPADRYCGAWHNPDEDGIGVANCVRRPGHSPLDPHSGMGGDPLWFDADPTANLNDKS